MCALQIGSVPDSRVIVPYYGTGALFFLLLSILLFLASGELGGHYFAPKILAIVHTAALGWGTMIIFGAAYQLLPVISERKLYSSRLAGISYVLLTPGTLLLIWSFWTFQVGYPLIIGGSLIVLSSLLFAINTILTIVKSKTESVEKYFIVSSALWLVITTSIGLLLAINLSHHFIPRNHLDILKLHAHAGLAGWFLQLITGVSSKLIPMFLLGKSKNTWLLYCALVLQNTGLLLFLADGYFNPIESSMLVYAAPVALGILAWIVYLVDAFRKRLRKKTDILMKTSMLSFLFLVGGLAVLPQTFSSDLRWAALYGIFLFLGWITALILGQTFKTLPFIVWNAHYKAWTGKIKVPLPKNLYQERLTLWQHYLLIAALSVLILGLMGQWSFITRIGVILWILLAAVYVWNVFIIIFHKPRLPHGNSTQ